MEFEENEDILSIKKYKLFPFFITRNIWPSSRLLNVKKRLQKFSFW